jgi:hypothetical protein
MIEEIITAAIIMLPPMTTEDPGLSPVTRRTQTGFSTGSMAQVSIACTAVMCFMPNEKRAQAAPRLKIPIKAMLKTFAALKTGGYKKKNGIEHIAHVKWEQIIMSIELIFL